jgi:hypothetical protein
VIARQRKAENKRVQGSWGEIWLILINFIYGLYMAYIPPIYKVVI